MDAVTDVVPPSSTAFYHGDDGAHAGNRAIRIHSWAGGSPFPGGLQDETFGDGDGGAPIGRGWGSPSSEPTSPDGSPRGKARASGSLVGGVGGSMLSLPKVRGGHQSG